MNTRHAQRIRYAIRYARDVIHLFATFGPRAQRETFDEFTPKHRLEARAYQRTWRTRDL